MIKLSASDGFILNNNDNYADIVFLSDNADTSVWEEIEITDEIYQAHPYLYRSLETTKTYKDGEHVMDGLNLMAYHADGNTYIKTFSLPEETGEDGE